MSKRTGETPEESTPLVSKRNHGRHVRTEVPIIRARIVSTFIPVFALSAMSVKDSLVPQYLVNRLGRDAGYLNNTSFKSCSHDINDSVVKIANELQSQTSELLTYYSYVQCIPAFFTCLFIGSYSDYLGRRFLLLLPVFTNMVKMILISVIIRFDLNLNFMYLAYGIDGIAGSWFTMILALYAVTADTSITNKSRTFWIYFISVSSATVEAAANVADGYLISYYGFFEASLLLSSMITVAFIIPFFFMPETLLHSPEQREFSPLVHLKRIFGFYFLKGSLRKKATYCLGLLLFVVGISNTMCISSIDALYQMHQPFCWSSTKIGYYNSLRSAAAYILGGIFLKILQRCMTSEKIAMLGVLFQGVAFIFEAFIWESWQFYLVPLIGGPSSPLIAIIRSMLSLLTESSMQGALFSSIAVVETVIGFIAVLVWNSIYRATVSFMPGFIYLAMAGCSFLTCGLFVIYLNVRERPQSLEHTIAEEQPTVQ